MANSLENCLDPWLKKKRGAAVKHMPLDQFKQNCLNHSDFSETLEVLHVTVPIAFLFLLGILNHDCFVYRDDSWTS